MDWINPSRALRLSLTVSLSLLVQIDFWFINFIGK